VNAPERHLRLLTETIEAVNSTLDLEEVLSQVATKVADALHADACFVYLYDERTGELVLRATHGTSVEEMTQPKQIAKAAKHARAGAVISALRSTATLTLGPVGPLGRNEGATSVGQAGQHEENALASDTANDRERTALKRVTLAGNRYRSGEISAMGSLSPLPSIPLTPDG
jgi:GAF domain-containing protein